MPRSSQIPGVHFWGTWRSSGGSLTHSRYVAIKVEYASCVERGPYVTLFLICPQNSSNCCQALYKQGFHKLPAFLFSWFQKLFNIPGGFPEGAHRDLATQTRMEWELDGREGLSPRSIKSELHVTHATTHFVKYFTNVGFWALATQRRTNQPALR